MTSLPNLFSPLAIGECTIPNRIVFSGHHTYLADRIPGDSLIAYLEARAKGGVGLIVSEVVAVHESAGFASKLLVADSAEVVPHYRRLTDACKAHGTAIFAQLFHPGREVLSTASGMAPLAFAPSATPNERFHIMPKPLSVNMIESIINGYGNAATHLAAAGFDGFEIVASHGYLPAQFINPRVNLRDDDYGGDFARRCKFLREVATRVRDCAPQKVLGLRISAAELDGDGLSEDEIIKVGAAFVGVFDYFSVTLGTSSGLKGAVHIAPPMGVDIAYIAPFARRLREAVDAPIIATGRINQPQDAEQILARGDADLCGMTRAMICDAALPAKARAGDLDAIRACIGCNQSCIGRAHKGLGVSCIQHPESGREVEFATTPKVVSTAKKILVAGGGVAGLKAAAVAASRGHKVTLCEKQNALGGQSNLACRLPGRAEFGGIVNNLKREAEDAGVTINVGVKVDAKFIADNQYDDIIIATGATPYQPDIAGVTGDNVVKCMANHKRRNSRRRARGYRRLERRLDRFRRR